MDTFSFDRLIDDLLHGLLPGREYVLLTRCLGRSRLSLLTLLRMLSAPVLECLCKLVVRFEASVGKLGGRRIHVDPASILKWLEADVHRVLRHWLIAAVPIVEYELTAREALVALIDAVELLGGEEVVVLLWILVLIVEAGLLGVSNSSSHGDYIRYVRTG